MDKKREKKVHPEAQHGKGHGVTSLAMKKYGRNVARAMNQRGSARGR